MSEQIQETVVNSELFLSESNYPMINQAIVNSMPFPPIIKPKDLIVNKKSPQDNPNGKQIRAPNAFIIYRKAFVKAARDQGYVLPMTVISSMASASWDQEIAEVKEEYKNIAKETHKLLKEMFPKKSNQRKRKEKWNLVFFQNKSLDNNNDIIKESVVIPAEESSATNDNDDNDKNVQNFLLTNSSPDLSEFDGNILDELKTPLPSSFQEYLSSCLPEDENDLLLDNYYSEFTFDIPLTDKSSLNMTLAEVENFDLGFDNIEFIREFRL